MQNESNKRTGIMYVQSIFLIKNGNYLQAKKINCNIITIPPQIIEKIQKFGKSYDQLTIETVNGFLKDSKKSKYKI